MTRRTLVINITDGDVDEGDIICSLLERPYFNRSKEDKNEVLKHGRPKPCLDLFMKRRLKKKRCTRMYRVWSVDYNHWWYDTFEWLTASAENKKLYCWSCLLFPASLKEESIWTSGCNFDLAVLTEEAKKHELTTEHIQSIAFLKESKQPVDMHHFAKALVKNVLQRDRYNSIVKKNQKLFKKLIDVATMLYKQDLIMRCLLPDPINKNTFKILFDLVSEHDGDLKNHCEEMGDSFDDVIKSFLWDIMGCIKLNLQAFISSELLESKNHPFWSLQVDSVTNINGEHLHSMMLRYVDSNGTLQEKHLGFSSQSNNKSANNLFEEVNAFTRSVANKDYLVSQSYDGTCTYVDEFLASQEKVGSIAPGVVLVPSFDHDLNVMLLQGVSNVVGTRQFVVILEDFIMDTKNYKLLYKLLKMVPPLEGMHLKLDSNLLTHILKERNNLFLAYEERIGIDSVDILREMWVKADSFSKNLKDFNFVLFLLLFIEIFQATDQVVSEWRKDHLNVKSCSSVTKQAVLKLRQISSHQLISDAYLHVNGSMGPSCTDGVTDHRELHLSIIENIITQLSARFGNSYRQLSFLSLVDSTKFASHHSEFPENALASLIRLYDKHFKAEWLRDELKIFIYSDKQFHFLSPMEIIKLLITSELKEVLPETFKLFSLVAAMPIWPRDANVRSCTERTNAFIHACKVLGCESAQSEISSVIIDKPIVCQLAALDSWHDSLISTYTTEKNENEILLELKD